MSAEIKSNSNKATRGAIASPEEVLAAAELAVPVFHIAKYYGSIRLLRKKGYSWRWISDWLKQFRIEVSYVHLRRLFVEEDKRLSLLEERQLLELGMHPENIKETLEKDDPANRLPSADPWDEAEETS